MTTQMQLIYQYHIKSEEKSPPGRPCNRWEDNFKIDIKLIEWEVVDWVYLARGVVLQ
jgi:hypothetical protein